MIKHATQLPVKVIGYYESSLTQEVLYFGKEIVDPYGLPIGIITPEEFLALGDRAWYQYVIAFSQDLVLRQKVSDVIDRENLESPALIHDLAYIATQNVCIGKGVCIGPSAIVSRDVTLGNHVLLDPHVYVAHDVTIGDHSTLRPGVIVAGKVTIGAHCTFNIKSSVINGITIADNTLVGAFSGVTKSILEPGGTYLGTPARRVQGAN